MKRFTIIFSFIAIFIIASAFLQEKEYTVAELRLLYSGDPAKWPKPDLDQEAKKVLRILVILVDQSIQKKTLFQLKKKS